MMEKNRRLERVVHRFALGLALVIALVIPCGFAWVNYNDLSDSLDFKAKVKASALSSLIASTPDAWMFAENRLQGLISREPVPLQDELVKVLDKGGSVITQAGSLPPAPRSRSLTRSTMQGRLLGRSR